VPEIRKAPIKSARPCVNINSASAQELISLPGIGEATARKIVEHREKYGPFRRPEQIIIIDGMSERRYRALADLICTE
jgi:competence protein ComEA